MTCDEVREALLTASLAEIEALEPHLAACPDCTALAHGIRMVEHTLRAHVEDFVERPTEQPTRRRGNGLYGVLIALAVAATLALAVTQFEGWGPSVGAPPPEVEAADAVVETFRSVDVAPFSADGLTREQEDARVRDQMAAKASALNEAADALTEVAEHAEEDHWRIDAQVTLGDVYAEMADALETLHTPSYLNAEQLGIYRAQLLAKADAQRDRSLAAYRVALGTARAAEASEWGDDIEARIEAQAEATPTQAERNARFAAAMGPRTQRQALRILDTLDTCTSLQDPGAIRAEMTTVLDELSADAWENNDAWQRTIRARSEEIQEACPPAQ